MIRHLDAPTLGQATALRHLDTPVLEAMREAARSHFLKPGEVLLYQGDPIHAFYVIISGGVRLVNYTADGQAITLKIYGPGDVFGLLAVSGPYPHPTQIETVQDSVIISIDGQDVRRLMLAHPQLSLTLIDLLTAHVHEAHHRIRNMAFKRVDRRLALALLNLAAKFGRSEGDTVWLDVAITQRDLAEFTGSTVETINRTLTLWGKQGIVAVGHKRVDILNIAALEAMGENPHLDEIHEATNSA